jgi:hypothetical protein
LSPKNVEDCEKASFYIWNDNWTLPTHCWIILQLWSSCKSVNKETRVVPRTVSLPKCLMAYTQDYDLNPYRWFRCCGQECSCHWVTIYILCSGEYWCV